MDREYWGVFRGLMDTEPWAVVDDLTWAHTLRRDSGSSFIQLLGAGHVRIKPELVPPDHAEQPE